jgi:hypothetical protein
MDKWLAKFLDDTLEKRTDKTDILPQTVSVSGMSVPFPECPGEITTAHTASPYAPPLQSGWVVTYYDGQGRLSGGWEQRETSIVKQCHGTGQNCRVELSGGQRIPLRSIRAVGQTDQEGRLLAAWTVGEHGYDGRTEGRA